MSGGESVLPLEQEQLRLLEENRRLRAWARQAAPLLALARQQPSELSAVASISQLPQTLDEGPASVHQDDLRATTRHLQAERAGSERPTIREETVHNAFLEMKEHLERLAELVAICSHLAVASPSQLSGAELFTALAHKMEALEARVEAERPSPRRPVSRAAPVRSAVDGTPIRSTLLATAGSFGGRSERTEGA